MCFVEWLQWLQWSEVVTWSVTLPTTVGCGMVQCSYSDSGNICNVVEFAYTSHSFSASTHAGVILSGPIAISQPARLTISGWSFKRPLQSSQLGRQVFIRPKHADESSFLGGCRNSTGKSQSIFLYAMCHCNLKWLIYLLAIDLPFKFFAVRNVRVDFCCANILQSISKTNCLDDVRAVYGEFCYFPFISRHWKQSQATSSLSIAQSAGGPLSKSKEVLKRRVANARCA